MYIPKNRIKTNLYTPGNEFVIISTEENYSGYYHSLYTGEFFSGKTPNDSNIVRLKKFEVTGESSLPPNLTETNVIALFLEDPDPVVNQDQWNQKDIVTYLSLRNESTIDEQPREMPQFHYASPTEDDYQLGQFTRYFLVKVNELQYIEVSEKTYKKVTTQSENVVWELYTPFKTQWTIDGVEDDVNINNQFTSGDDYTLPNGLNYQGLYHIMPNEIAMTGRYHGEGEDILLTPISN